MWKQVPALFVVAMAFIMVVCNLLISSKKQAYWITHMKHRSLLISLIATLMMLSWSLASLGQAPSGLQGTIIVLNKSGHDASFIDLASGSMVATLATGRGPHELVVTSDGRWAVGTDYSGGNSLTVFDVSVPEVVRTIDLSDYPRPHGIVLLPGERSVVITSESSRKLVTVDFHSGEITGEVGTQRPGSHMVAVSADGRTAFTSNGGSDDVSIINLLAGEFVSSLNVPARPEAIQTNRMGSEVWVGSNDDEVVTVYDVSSGQQLAQWQGFSWPYRVLLTRDERLAIMPDLGNESLRFFEVADMEEIARMDFPGAQPQGVVLHPDDRTLFLSLSGQNRIAVIDIETRQIMGYLPAGSAPDGIGYSMMELR